MDTAHIKQILLEELQAYTGKGLNAYSYLTSNEAEQIYSVIDIATIHNKRIVSNVLIVRLLGDSIVIELDYNDKSLASALLARGIPAEHIILAYRGDVVPMG